MVKTLVGLFADAEEKKRANSQTESKDDSSSEVFEFRAKQYRYPFFLLNVARRLKTKDTFFEMIQKAGFAVEPIEKTLYLISHNHLLPDSAK